MSTDRGLATWPTVAGRPTYGVIGWPIAHSRSPAIHRAAYTALGIDAAYVHLPVLPDEMPQAMEQLVVRGFAGANVTMPHKAAAAAGATTASDDVIRLGAANTLVVGADGLAAHNTDVPGFTDLLTTEANWDGSGGRALIFGAGGAARACALALSRMGVAEIVVAARDRERADAVAACVEGATSVAGIAFSDAPGASADLVVNATPLGARGESLPHPPLEGVLVVDLLYDPPATPLLEAAATQGGRAIGGLGLLVHQAAHAFQIWFGVPAPLDAMWAGARGGAAG